MDSQLISDDDRVKAELEDEEVRNQYLSLQAAVSHFSESSQQANPFSNAPVESQVHTTRTVATLQHVEEVRSEQYVSPFAAPAHNIAARPHFLDASSLPQYIWINGPEWPQVVFPPSLEILNHGLEVKANSSLKGPAQNNLPRDTHRNHQHIDLPQRPLFFTPNLTQLNMPQSENTLQLARELQRQAMAALEEDTPSEQPTEAQLQDKDLTEQTSVSHSNEAPNDAEQLQISPSEAPQTTYRALLPIHPTPPTSLTSLPSFLQYVDRDLMLTLDKHNRPTDPTANCILCGWQHDLAPLVSTFVPLGCGHWLHYRCLVWNACQQHYNKDGCPHCGTKLFEWDGMNVMTVAARTGLEIQDQKWGPADKYWDPETGLAVLGDRDEYEVECWAIEMRFKSAYESGGLYSRYEDGSLDVIKIYQHVLDGLTAMGRPNSRWLRWQTYTGYLLFGILVAQKLRRWLGEVQAGIQETEGWREFGEALRGLQQILLAEVGKLVR